MLSACDVPVYSISILLPFTRRDNTSCYYYEGTLHSLNFSIVRIAYIHPLSLHSIFLVYIAFLRDRARSRSRTLHEYKTKLLKFLKFFLTSVKSDHNTVIQWVAAASAESPTPGCGAPASLQLTTGWGDACSTSNLTRVYVRA